MNFDIDKLFDMDGDEDEEETELDRFLNPETEEGMALLSLIFCILTWRLP